MKKLILIPVAIFCVLSGLVAQERQVIIGPGDLWKYSPSLTEEQLYNYDRLMNMSREDWALFTADPRFDSDRVNQIYRDHKEKVDWRTQSLAAAKSQPGESCSCLVEPDVEYTEIDWLDEADPLLTTSTELGVGGAGAGVDCYYGPINLPFSFCFFDQNVSSIYISSKGNIIFGTPYIDWTPSEFPIPVDAGEPQYDHICGYWADFDYRSSGNTYFLVTENEFFLNVVEAGYYNNHHDKLNTFQIILTSESSTYFSGENNVQICFQDMQWAHGDVGGGSGFNGTTPGNVGADRETGNNHVQFGRFNLNNDNYTGPYGQANAQQDGIDWLDYKSFDFDVCGSAANIPPIATTAVPCDTLYLCQDQILDLSTQFLSPEVGQNTQISWTIDGSGLEASAEGGNTAVFNGVFTGSSDNIGTNIVTVTATDNGVPSGQTVFTYIIQVLDVVLPPLTIEGSLAVCAGGVTELTASDGYDSYDWTETGCDEQVCLATGGGDVTVVGQLGECFNSATVTIIEEAFEYVPFTISQDPICPEETTEVCVEFPEEYVSFQWSAYPGWCGDFVAGTDLTAPCVTVGGDCESHLYILATDSSGCVDFNIPVVHIIESNISEENEIYEDYTVCDGSFEPLEFTGGYSSPAVGWLNLYLASGNSNGWLGSYIEITITPCDGDLPWDTILTSLAGFTLAAVPIEYCDEICIEYNSSGQGDANNTLYVFNCSNENDEIYGPGLSNGIIWCGTSGCVASPLPGTWTVDGPGGWTLTTDDEFNPFPDPNYFTPTEYGVYTLEFTDPACSAPHVYTVEYNLPPTVEILNPFDEILLCNGASTTLDIAYTDVGGTAEIDWDGSGVSPNSDGTVATVGPYNNCTTVNANVEVENGCGSAEDEITIIAQQEPNDPTFPSLEVFLCGGSDVLLDATLDGNCGYEYFWEQTGETTQDITVDESGEYCLQVSNGCGNSNDVCVDVTLVPNAEDPLDFDYYLECQDGVLEVCVNEFNVPDGYLVTWLNNGNSIGSGECIDLTSSSTGYSVQVTDPYGCNTQATGNVNFTGWIDVPPVTNGGNLEPEIVCPGQEMVLDLDPNTNVLVNWTASCGIGFPNQNPVTFTTDMVPVECLGTPVTITGYVDNPCGTDSETWVFIPDACSVLIPNIFTPDGDDLNSTFYIEGLENYFDVIFKVFDRWGNEVYATENYENDWGPRDLTEGTYYYILVLPFGTITEFDGYFTVIK